MLRPWLPQDEVPIEELYDDLGSRQGAPGRPFVYINMVETVDGKVTIEGTTAGIGSRVDRRMMMRLRTFADAILNGAGTLRMEDITPRVPEPFRGQRLARGLSPYPLGIIVTRGADLPLDRRFFTLGDFRAVVITGAGAPEANVSRLRERAEVYRTASPHPEPAEIVRILEKQLSVRRLLIEGGPEMNFAFLAAGLVDEIFLTTAPRLVGGRAARTLVEGAGFAPADGPRLELVSIFEHQDELFRRYRVVR